MRTKKFKMRLVLDCLNKRRLERQERCIKLRGIGNGVVDVGDGHIQQCAVERNPMVETHVADRASSDASTNGRVAVTRQEVKKGHSLGKSLCIPSRQGVQVSRQQSGPS